MTTLLLGADGQVGRALRHELHSHAPLITATRAGSGTDLACDLASPDAVMRLLDRVAPSLIVNAAAYTAVDRAESERDIAYALNAQLPHKLGEWAARHDASVVHYSTDYVFDGTARTPYGESAPTAPLGCYGNSKRDGELALAATGCRHLILRTAWVYGPEGKNFLLTILRLAAERTELDIVSDQQGTPTSAPWIANATAHILRHWKDHDPGGIFNLTANGSTTWKNFAEAIVTKASSLGLIASPPPIRPITTAQYPTPARRPAYSVLDGGLVEHHFHLHRPDWTELLNQVLDRMEPHTR